MVELARAALGSFVDHSGCFAQLAKKPYCGSQRIVRGRLTVRYSVLFAEMVARYLVEPDPAEMAERYGAETAVPDWAARLVCGQCGSRRGRYGAERGEAALKPGGNAGVKAADPGGSGVAPASVGE